MAVAEAATVKISKSEVTMVIAATTTLKVAGTKSKATWKTSNKKVASVNSKGVVTANSTGTAKITATVNKKNYTVIVSTGRTTEWTVSLRRSWIIRHSTAALSSCRITERNILRRL